MSIKLRSVYTGKFVLAANHYTAAAAHAGAVYHDGVEAGRSFNAERFGGRCHVFHHDNRADGQYQVNLFACLQHFTQRVGYKALAACTAVIGGQNQLVADSRHFILPDYQILVARTDDGDNLVAQLVICTRDGINRRNADAAANYYNSTELAHLGRMSQRTYYVENIITLVKGVAQVLGGVAHRLHN